MKHAKKLIALTLALVCLTLSMSSCATLTIGTLLFSSLANSNNDVEEFYELVSENKELLDIYADDIYSCWYDYVYEDEYSSVDSALIAAMADNYDNIERIEENNKKIKDLYKDAKDSDLEDEVKEVMQAYNEYYAFVMEVSGSFNSYSAGLEPLKKALATALRNLEIEL